jgi:hypothetical protein
MARQVDKAGQVHMHGRHDMEVVRSASGQGRAGELAGYGTRQARQTARQYSKLVVKTDR